MSIHLTRPSATDLRSLAAASEGEELTYSPVGVTTIGSTPDGYRFDRWSRDLGGGPGVFERAADLLREWGVHTGAGLVVEASGPPTIGQVVAMAAPLPVGYIDVACRVVDVVDEPDRHGFTYGTLPVHPEQGEESFTVRRADDGMVAFEIVAVSRPQHHLATLVPSVARVLQTRAIGRYLDAMEAAVRS